LSLFVVDASVVAKCLSDDAVRLLDEKHELASADVTWGEIGNVLVHDSVYLALAVALDCRLVTADERLTNALGDGPLGRHVLWVGLPSRFN
jgi:predicted nucleic acid-binding protein